MARIVEQIIAVKISRIIKESEGFAPVLTEEQASALMQGIPALAENIIDNPSVVVEVFELE